MIALLEIVDTKVLLRLGNYALLRLKNNLKAREVHFSASATASANIQKQVELTADDLQRFECWPCQWPDQLLDAKLETLVGEIVSLKDGRTTLCFANPQLTADGSSTRHFDPETGMSLRVWAIERETTEGRVLEARLDIIFCWAGEAA